MVDAFGNPTSFSWSAAKFTVLQGTIDCCQPCRQMLIANKAFDANEQVLASPAVSGTGAVISPKSNHTTNQDYDHDLYQARHLIKNHFAKLKQFRVTAAHYNKTAQKIFAAIHFAKAIV